MKKFDAVVIGDVNIDLIVAGYGEPPLPGQEVFVENMLTQVGGGAALFSLALAKLGMKLAFHGILGKDYYGQYLLDQFEQSGIDTRSMIFSDKNRTGITIALHPEKDRSFITYAGSNAELSLRRINMKSVTEGRHVHLTGYKGSANHAEFAETVKELKEYGLSISFDTGWDNTGEWYSGILELAGQIDVFFMNETEALHYTGCENVEEAIRLLSKYAGHVVVKLGSKGATAVVNGKTTYHPGFRVKSVNTTGAGDSFNAGYIYGYLTGEEPKKCLEYGNACGALSVGAYGGSTGAADRETIERMIAEHAGSGH
ncbi:carbohydrate kinase family protein [Paenibacillus harenae]|uniref:carbohydrate kinase family protein n=1 Tax=Paenibacillus harenae TaxID=306543 RepID=UPI0003F4C032|nr:carbohydrate kinase family protein [Paenibacillus harenae]